MHFDFIQQAGGGGGETWIRHWSYFAEDRADFSVHNISPSSVLTYTMSVTTGDKPQAATVANVYCSLIGRWGDTAKGRLTKCQNETKFQRDQVMFSISALRGLMVNSLMGSSGEFHFFRDEEFL